MVADTRVGSADTGDRDRAAATGGQRTRRGKVDSEVISRIAASPGQSDAPVRRRRRTHGCVDIDAVNIAGLIGAGIAVEQHIAGRRDGVHDQHVPALQRDRPQDREVSIGLNLGSIRRAADGQSGQRGRQVEPAGIDGLIEGATRRTEGERAGRGYGRVRPVGIEEREEDVCGARGHRRAGLEAEGRDIPQVDVGVGVRAGEFDRTRSGKDRAALEDDCPDRGAVRARNPDAAAGPRRGEEIPRTFETDRLTAGIGTGGLPAGSRDVDRGGRGRGRGQ